MINWRYAVAAACSTMVLVAVASRTGQSLYSDPAAQFKTVQQVLSGESPRLNTWRRPDMDDLGRDSLQPLGWWAPGTPLVAFPLMRAGLSPAKTARALAIMTLLAGGAGWACWFALFDLPPAATLALSMLLPWTRDASNALFQFTAETLVFATVPWVLIGVLVAHRRQGMVWWAAAGASAGLLYIVKYSASFVTAGVVLWLSWRAWHERGRWPQVLLVFSAAAAAPIAALTIFNSRIGTSNLLVASLGSQFSWPLLVHAAGLPGLAAADLDAVARWLVMHPTHGITQNPLWISAIGVPGGLLLIALTARRSVSSDAAALARAILGVTLVAILGVWVVSTGVSVEARHVASASLCALPLALAEGWRVGRSSSRACLAVSAACALYVVVPLLYGPMSVFAKVRRFPTDFHASTTGLYNPLLADTDVAGVVTRLQRDFHPDTDIWYLTDPLSALDLRGRTLMVHADFVAVDELRKYRFLATSRPVRVHVLLPQRFEINGKGEVIRESFPQAIAWTHDAIPGSEYDRWVADLRPDGH